MIVTGKVIQSNGSIIFIKLTDDIEVLIHKYDIKDESIKFDEGKTYQFNCTIEDVNVNKTGIHFVCIQISKLNEVNDEESSLILNELTDGQFFVGFKQKVPLNLSNFVITYTTDLGIRIEE